MKIKKILSILSILAITSSIFLACETTTKTKINDDSNNKTIEELADDGNVQALESKINTKDSKEIITQNVNALTTSMYNLSGKYNYFTHIFADDLRNITDSLKDNQDILDDDVIKNINSETIKGFLKDCKKNNFKIFYDKSNFYVKPKLDYIIDKYGEFIDADLKDVLVFRNDEDVNSVFNNGTGSFNIELLTTKILNIESKIADSNNAYYRDWLSYLEYYYDALFGYSHSLYIKDQNTQEVYSDTINSYKKIISDNPNSQLAKDLQGYVDLLEKNNKCRNDETQKYLSDMFSERFAPLSSNDYEEDSQSLEQAQKQENTSEQKDSSQSTEPEQTK